MSRDSRDEFPAQVKEAIAKRAAYHCSNPNCQQLTVKPSVVDQGKWIDVGIVAHITAASPGGPRYDERMGSEERRSASNGIYLCGTCSIRIDKNGGVDYPIELLHGWKYRHEERVASSASLLSGSQIAVVDGSHEAEGAGNIIALDIEGPASLQPGTRSKATGAGNVTATKIRGGTAGSGVEVQNSFGVSKGVQDGFQAEVRHGLRCPNGCSSIGIFSVITVGGPPDADVTPKCRVCGSKMIPDTKAPPTLVNATCPRCKSFYGMVQGTTICRCGSSLL